MRASSQHPNRFSHFVGAPYMRGVGPHGPGPQHLGGGGPGIVPMGMYHSFSGDSSRARGAALGLDHARNGGGSPHFTYPDHGNLRLGGGMGSFRTVTHEHPHGIDYGAMRLPGSSLAGVGGPGWLGAYDTVEEMGSIHGNASGRFPGMQPPPVAVVPGLHGGQIEFGGPVARRAMDMGMSGDMAGTGSVPQPQSRAIFISQISVDVTHEDICSTVGAYGPIESTKILRDKRHAFVSKFAGLAPDRVSLPRLDRPMSRAFFHLDGLTPCFYL